MLSAAGLQSLPSAAVALTPAAVEWGRLLRWGSETAVEGGPEVGQADQSEFCTKVKINKTYMSHDSQCDKKTWRILQFMDELSLGCLELYKQKNWIDKIGSIIT